MRTLTRSTVVAQRAVVVDGKELTVSTVRIAADYYDTVVFDDSTDKRHSGMTLGGFVIDTSSVRSPDRDTAMDVHREALLAARDEKPIPSAEQVADMLGAPATVYGELTAWVHEQVGAPSAAHRLLASAHRIVADRLWNAA
ncbi:hypothetical protein ACWCPT_29635 [Streptomyces sp. NPDC002308]